MFPYLTWFSKSRSRIVKAIVTMLNVVTGIYSNDALLNESYILQDRHIFLDATGNSSQVGSRMGRKKHQNSHSPTVSPV